MDLLSELLSYQIGNYSAYDFVLAAGVFFGILLLCWALKAVIVSRLKYLAKKTDTLLDDHIVGVIDSISAVFYFVVALYFALAGFEFNETISLILRAIFLIVIVWQATKSLVTLIECVLMHFGSNGKSGARFSGTMISGVKFVINLLLWSVAALLILSNLGLNITSLVASLGIGGIAIALAAQNILGDIFASFSIYFDRPFDIGDFISVGETQGTVKKIGLKTTRIASIDGEEVIVSNKELTNSRIQNFGRMKERRVAMTFGLIYGTKSAQLKEVPQIVEKVVSSLELAEFQRCHFVDFGESSLDFEFVFIVKSGDYGDAMDTKQSILLGIKEQFEKAKIEMAFPTRTVYLQK